MDEKLGRVIYARVFNNYTSTWGLAMVAQYADYRKLLENYGMLVDLDIRSRKLTLNLTITLT